MRYCVVADIHLNENRRLDDTVAALDQIAEIVKKHRVNKLISLGDVYTNRRPSSRERLIFERWVMKLTRLVDEVILLVGNHDCFPDGLNSYHSFVELHTDKVRVVENPGFEGEFFLGHLLLSEAKMGPEDYQSSSFQNVADLIQKYPSPLRSGAPCKAYLLGDVHKAQTIQKDPLVIYAGSINRVDFGERDDEKSVLLIDDIDEYPKFKCKRLVLKSRPMVQIDVDLPNWGNPYDDFPTGAIVKIIFHGTAEQIKTQVDENDVRKIYNHAKELIIQYDVTKEVVARDKRVNENITPQTALELYLERLDLSNEEKQGILKLSMEIVDAEA